ncbi:MAG: hypothetical protein WKF35_10590 [Ferruginibacter sp.]
MHTIDLSNDAQKTIAEAPAKLQSEINAAIAHLQTPITGNKKTKNHPGSQTIQVDNFYSIDYLINFDTIRVLNVRKKTDDEKEDSNGLVISYMFLRKLIGICGILLPFALAIAPERVTGYYGLEASISDYYYTSRGDFLVVLLSILGIFLFTYKGYEFKEKLLTRIAALCAFGIAFVPTKARCNDCLFSVHTNSGGVFGNIFGEGIHIIFAAVFFICLGMISIIYFSRTNALSPTTSKNKLTRKSKRNIIYMICGWVMLSCVALLGIYFFIQPDLKNFPVIFVLETIAIWAFGISWLTKGEALLPDKNE